MEFRENRHRILVSCRCLDEGIDVPDAGIGIVMSSSAVERQRVQRLGRVIRRTDGKQSACLYYIYIRESTDDAAYLPHLEENDTFGIRYYPAEGVFANDLYEYAAAQIIAYGRARGYDKKQTKELRRCVEEGLVRADYLLPAAVQEENREQSKDKHSKNYKYNNFNIYSCCNISVSERRMLLFYNKYMLVRRSALNCIVRNNHVIFLGSLADLK